MNWFAPRNILFAFDRYCAVILALYVSFGLDLPNPWWAMVTVFLSQPAQPLAGAIWARATYRAVGTIVGLVAALIIIPNLSNAPELMILALAGWIGFCVFVGMLDRSPRSYAFLLSGYTAALVGLPTAVNPIAIFDVAVARTEEILIGVLASAIVQSLTLPKSVATAMTEKLDGVMTNVRRWLGEGLEALHAPTSRPTPERVAMDLTELNLMATDLKFEAAMSRAGGRALRALEERLVGLLPLVNAVEDRLNALTEEGFAVSEIKPVLERITAWATAAGAPKAGPLDPVLQDIHQLAPALGPHSNWRDLLLTSLSARLAEIVTSWNECQLLRAALRKPALLSDPQVLGMLGAARPRLLHVDYGVAALSGLVAAAVVVCGAAFAVAAHWEQGALAIGIAAVACSLFAAADDPTPMVLQFMTGFVVAFPFAVLYEFAIIPAIDGFVLLAVALFPFIFVNGLFLAQRKYFLRALATSIGFSSGLALQPDFVSDFATFMNVYIALLIGALLALTGLQVARVLPVNRVIRRIVRAVWRDIALLTTMASPPTRAEWASRMLDRIGLLMPRLAQVAGDDQAKLTEALQDLRLGASIIELRHLRDNKFVKSGTEIDLSLQALRDYFAALSHGKEHPLAPTFVEHLDAGLAQILQCSKTDERFLGVIAAVGLRRSFFPQAPAYQAARAA